MAVVGARRRMESMMDLRRPGDSCCAVRVTRAELFQFFMMISSEKREENDVLVEHEISGEIKKRI